jgi:hypothetical protein
MTKNPNELTIENRALVTKTAALELGRDNIRVNSIHPGAIRTPILADHAPDAAAMATTMAGAGVGSSAIPRIADPEEITQMVLFVASDEASFSTGSVPTAVFRSAQCRSTSAPRRPRPEPPRSAWPSMGEQQGLKA